MRQQRKLAAISIGQQPDDQARRSRHRCGPAQHEQGAVQHGADDDAAEFGTAEGRQLQGEGGGQAGKDGDREQPGQEQGHSQTEHDERRQPRRRAERCANAGRPAQEEHGHHRDQGRKTSVAGGDAVGEDGHQPLSRAVDDAAAADAHRIAAVAHAHGKGLFAAGAAAAEAAVQIVGHPGQEARVLQQGEQREKDGHGRQHHRHHPGQHPEHALGQSVAKHFRRAEGRQGRAEPAFGAACQGGEEG